MSIEGDKILALITYYSNIKGYPQRSHIVNFCRDFNLNYNQWNAYVIGKQGIGVKPIFELIRIFPNINLNWLLKNEGNMFNVLDENSNIELPDYLDEKKQPVTLEKIHKEILELKEHINNKLFVMMPMGQ